MLKKIPTPCSSRIFLLLPAIVWCSNGFTVANSETIRDDRTLICEREMLRAADEFGVPAGVLFAVGLTETGRGGILQPYAMNIEGKPVFATGLEEALAIFARARATGARLIDIGCMQINHRYHGDHFTSVAEMFDPRRNVAYAAAYLRDLRAREGSWTLAVARYHAGPNNNPAQKQYVCTVIGQLVATGFGAWTPRARDFCR